MRVRVSDPSLLSDLCDHLSRRGCTALEASEDEANVLIPGAPSSFEEATMLMAEIDLWRAKRAGAEVMGDRWRAPRPRALSPSQQSATRHAEMSPHPPRHSSARE